MPGIPANSSNCPLQPCAKPNEPKPRASEPPAGRGAGTGRTLGGLEATGDGGAAMRTCNVPIRTVAGPSGDVSCGFSTRLDEAELWLGCRGSRATGCCALALPLFPCADERAIPADLCG